MIPPRRSVRGPWRAHLFALAALALALSACQGSGYSYVKNGDLRTYLRVPGTWQVFDEDEIFRTDTLGVSPQMLELLQSSQWVVAFDADPGSQAVDAFTLNAEQPRGFTRVRAIQDDERDTFSLSSLRNEVVGYDDLLAQGALEPLKRDTITEGGLRGTHDVFNVKVEDSYYTFTQLAYVDPATSRATVLFVGCSAACYLEHQDTINDVATSLTIKE